MQGRPDQPPNTNLPDDEAEQQVHAQTREADLFDEGASDSVAESGHFSRTEKFATFMLWVRIVLIALLCLAAVVVGGLMLSYYFGPKEGHWWLGQEQIDKVETIFSGGVIATLLFLLKNALTSLDKPAP